MPGSSAKVTSVVALLCVAALGYGAGRWSARPPEPRPREAQGAQAPPEIAAELQSALVEPDLLVRTARVASALKPLGPEALDPVLQAYDAVVIDTADAELILLLDWWARFDPRGALAWAKDTRIGWHPAVIAAATRVWAREDPEEAGKETRSTIRDDRLLAAATNGLVRGWEESGRGGLEDYIAGLPVNSPRGIEVLSRIKVAREGPEQAIAWAEDLPEDGSFRQEAIERVAEAMAETEPQTAGAWIARMRSERSDGDLALVLRLTMRWARKDGDAAMQWVRSLAPAADIPTAIQETFRTWYMNDREGASAWIEAVELEPSLDPAVATYALQQSATDPDRALEWANRVQDQELRERVLVKIGLSYSVAAPEKAPEWLARVDLPEEVRAKIEAFRSRNAQPGAVPQPGATPSP